MTAQDPPPTGAGSARLAASIQAVRGFLDEQLEALEKSAPQALLLAARDAEEHEEEARLLVVMDEVEALCPLAVEAFRDAMLAKLRVPDTQSAPAEAAGGGLDLVETAKVDDWVRLRRLLLRHTDEARAVETRVWERLAAAAGVSAHPDDCPVSLQGVCVLFQGAMQNLGTGRDARAAIYDAFEVTVVKHLGQLVADLDALPDDVSVDTATPLKDAALAAGVTPSADTTSVFDEAQDPARLLSVLANVQRNVADTAGITHVDAENFEAQLEQAVAPPGVALGERERHTVAVIARVMREVMHSPKVDSGVKRRLMRLAPPLLMLTLQGDDYLTAELNAARHDPVTGLLDRSALRSRLEAVLQRSGPDGTGPAVCLVDVDGFGAITARLGHEVGGRLLRALGDLLRNYVGAAGFVARIRGDEFAVVVLDAKVGTGRRFAEHYLSAVSNARFASGGEEVGLSVSIGVVESDAGLTTPGALMRAADEARRAAKAAGGGCLRVHTTVSGRLL